MCMYLSIHCSIDIRLEDPLPVATLGAIPSHPYLMRSFTYKKQSAPDAAMDQTNQTLNQRDF